MHAHFFIFSLYYILLYSGQSIIKVCSSEVVSYTTYALKSFHIKIKILWKMLHKQVSMVSDTAD